jgi:hypothetical protein
MPYLWRIIRILKLCSYNWNPAVGKDCSGLYEGWYLCVGKYWKAVVVPTRKKKPKTVD